MTNLLQSIDRFCDALPRLPASRYLSMNLFLHEAPRQADAFPEFEPWRFGHLLFPDSKEWLRQSDDFQQISSALHTTGLRVSYADAQRVSSSGHEPPHPGAGEYVRMVPVEHDLAIMVDRHKSRYCRAWRHTMNNTETIYSSLPDHALSPQPTHDQSFSVKALHIKQALQAMQEAEELTQGETQPDSTMITQQTAVLSQRTSQVLSLVQLNYGEERIQALKSRESTARQTTCGLAREIGGRTASGQTILCLCGFALEEGDLVCSPIRLCTPDLLTHYSFNVVVVAPGSMLIAMVSLESRILVFRSSTTATSACWKHQRQLIAVDCSRLLFLVGQCTMH